MSLIPFIMVAAAIGLPLASSSASAAHKTEKAAGTIVEVAAGNPDFSTLVAALKAAGLVDALSGKGPFTVFAPTNAAFAALPAGTLDDLLKPANKAKLVAILSYHVIPAKIESSALAGKKLTSPATLQGGSLKVDGTHGVKINDATVTSADVKASNGVIHVIDKVLMPAS
ncbi:MAG: fasciclin domain-containing protein [Alphaproteobacteria bacterium]|nr:fasciclin domain-containing protein [Alphaproteobacteria bacterium]